MRLKEFIQLAPDHTLINGKLSVTRDQAPKHRTI